MSESDFIVLDVTDTESEDDTPIAKRLRSTLKGKEATKGKAKTTGTQGKCWVFTINNPIDTDRPTESELVPNCIWQLERGADGTRHYQVYLFCFIYLFC